MSLPTLLKQLRNRRILVVGDLMLDHYIWGDVQRISPEAPVPVVNAKSDTYTAGGAANVALNLASLGVKTSLLGYVAKDEAGERLLRILSENDIEFIQTSNSSEAPTIIKTRVIIRSQQLCRIDRESAPRQYSIENSEGFEPVLQQALQNVDAVIVSDYAKGVVTQTLLNKLLAESQNNTRFLVAIDPKPSRHLSLANVGLVTPNRSEALSLAALNEVHEDEPYPVAEVCRKIFELHHPQLVVVTLGAEGMAICKEGEVVELLPTNAREVFDVSGAGDTVIATLTAALVSGALPEQAARLANTAAGCVVGHMGTVPISYQELKEALSGNSSVQKTIVS